MATVKEGRKERTNERTIIARRNGRLDDRSLDRIVYNAYILDNDEFTS